MRAKTIGLLALCWMTAATGEDAAEKGVNRLDADNDGFLTYDEAAADPELVPKFIELDKDLDGKLNEAEFAKYESHDPPDSADKL